ncbi:MAG TPA: TIGR01777 family oxidoreductase, partial [Candidatus Eisenbacteria bacterium]|nr:TIGR01777 family oxidoreductase [Candidatus Eisenbacteria bacterium]
MRIAISGASGLIGTALTRHLTAQGHRVLRIVRRAARDATEVGWDPDAGTIDAAALEGIDAAVNLSGSTIARWPWTSGHRRHVLESRTRSTALLARTLASLTPRPRVFVSGSAVGYYGDRGSEILTETSGHGAGFLADVCRAWESAADPAAHAGIRLAIPRIGLVVSGEGGMLPVLATPFRLGLGGPVGSGRQYMSWIAIDDLVRAITFMIERDDRSGPWNAVAPQSLPQAEFARTLGRVLHRPAIVPFPAFAARLLLGGLADLLLEGQRVEPARLLSS